MRPTKGYLTPTKRAPAQRCSCCRGHTVRLRQRPGRTISYRTFPALPLPASLPIHACSRCGAEYPERQDGRELDRVLEKLFQAELRRLAEREIRALTAHVSQRNLERLMGLSQGYLCRLAAKAGNPAPPLVLLLALLAKDPEMRLRELANYWREPREPQELDGKAAPAPGRRARRGHPPRKPATS